MLQLLIVPIKLSFNNAILLLSSLSVIALNFAVINYYCIKNFNELHCIIFQLDN